MICGKWCTTALLLIGLLPAVEASTNFGSQTNIDFQPSVVTQNLTQKVVTQIFQDSNGNLWFATQEGLNRYDGYELENYRYSLTNPLSLSHDATTSIVEDNEGTVWISTRGGGLNRYDPIKNGFSSLLASGPETASPLSNDVLTIFADQDGDIWLGYDNAFSCFNPRTGEFVHYFPQREELPYLGEINSFTQDSKGTIWAATLNAGLLKINKDNMSMAVVDIMTDREKSLEPQPIFHVFADSQDLIWSLSLSSGATKYDPLTEASEHYSHSEKDLSSLSSNTAFDIFEDKDNRLWISTLDGLNLYDAVSNSFRRFSTHNTNLPSSRIHSIYQSREGVYWAGTVLGLATGFKNLFSKFNTSTGQLSNDSVNAFGETDDGSIWIGTDDGLNRLKNENTEFTWINEYSNPSISDSTVMSLLGENNVLWIGTFSGGLNRLDIKRNTVYVFRNSRFDDYSLAANGVTSIARVSSGSLLVGTYGGGLSVLNESTGKFTNHAHDPTNPESISNNNVIAVFQDSLGQIWIGTENGLNLFDELNSKFERIYTERGNTDSVSSDMVWSFYEDMNQDLWLGTKGGGVNRWTKNDRRKGVEKFSHYSENIALPSSNIYGIQSDRDGNIWLSHNRGVTKLNPDTGESRHYGVRDGLQDTEFNMGASFKASNGLIYFGGNLGFNVIDSEGFIDKENPPLVSISEIKVMNERKEFEKPYNDLSEITLTHKDSMFSVEFFAADYSNPTLIKYAYKMTGINDKWVISEDARQASFTTLPPGKYELKLAAASPSGTWNWDSKSIQINVLPPPWRSIPAYAIYSVIVLAIIMTYIIQQQAKARAGLARQKELELKVQERTIDLEKARKAAVQASKAKSDFLATMSHEIRTPMHGMIGMTELLLHTDLSGQQRKFASAAHNSSKALLELINDILDFSKIEASRVDLEQTPFDLIALIEDACYLQSEPAAREGLELTHMVDTSVPSMLLGDPLKIRQILINLLNNAIKFTPRGEINVVAKYSCIEPTKNGLLEIKIKDTGIGMDSETTKNVFEPFTQADASTTRQYGGTGLGLSITKNYIELMGGKISVHSALNVGTEIIILLPSSEVKRADQKIQPLQLGDRKFRIISRKSATREMITAQLRRLGGMEIIESDELYGLPQPDIDDIWIIDLENTKLHDEFFVDGATNPRGILFLPVHEIQMAPHRIDWLNLTKPCTSETLRVALEELVSGRSLEKNREINASNTVSNQRLRILVAEDIPTNQRIAQEMLEMSGHTVDIAVNGQQAIEKQKKNRYDVIFMDCQMPMVDGYQATRAIREHELNHKLDPVTIIALTAGITVDDKRSFFDSGMDGYLGKPFTISEITNTLQDQLGINAKIKGVDFQPRHQNKEIVIEVDETKGAIDFSAINNIIQIELQTGKSILPEVYEGFLSQMSEKMNELLSFSETDNRSEIQSASHAIKSMSANLGAKKVKSIATMIESSAKSHATIDLKFCLAELDISYKEFQKEFEENYGIKPKT
jgi:signal transduction histidine kinase/ligand-binding sensor domain-containing protein/CheY-like chemotaxis protein/HPt (histidine-containing phosphotransfer) domain-containing protein